MLKPTPEAKPAERTDAGSLSIRALFDNEESNLLRFAFSLTGRRAVAEEIVQEVFLQLHAKWSEVQEPRAWLFRSVRNQAFHYLRKSQRETLHSDHDTTCDTHHPEESPDALIARMESIAELRNLLAKLPDQDQRLIQLKYFEGLKYRDISQKTGLTISNVGYRLHQVLRKLATALLPSEADDKS